MNDTSEQAIERRLRDAQAAVVAAREAPRLRQQAVKEARDAGWTKYKIAKTLGVNAPTVDSIIETIERREAQQ
jgi:hypothetical protein